MSSRHRSPWESGTRQEIPWEQMSLQSKTLSSLGSGQSNVIVSIVLARDPPSRHSGRVYDHFGGFWRDRHPSRIRLNRAK